MSGHVYCWQANWLKSEGVKKGDCVTIYLPMVPYLHQLMLILIAYPVISVAGCSALCLLTTAGAFSLCVTIGQGAPEMEQSLRPMSVVHMMQVCELPIAMLACARIGAVHNVVFAGFSSESLAQRLQDCKCEAGHAAPLSDTCS